MSSPYLILITASSWSITRHLASMVAGTTLSASASVAISATWGDWLCILSSSSSIFGLLSSAAALPSIIALNILSTGVFHLIYLKRISGHLQALHLYFFHSKASNPVCHFESDTLDHLILHWTLLPWCKYFYASLLHFGYLKKSCADMTRKVADASNTSTTMGNRCDKLKEEVADLKKRIVKFEKKMRPTVTT